LLFLFLLLLLYKSALNTSQRFVGAAYQPGYFFSSDSLSLTSLRKSNHGFSLRLFIEIFKELLYICGGNQVF